MADVSDKTNLSAEGQQNLYAQYEKKGQNDSWTFAGFTHPAVALAVTLGQQHLKQFSQSVNKFLDLL